jgi:hypothetical protein
MNRLMMVAVWAGFLMIGGCKAIDLTPELPPETQEGKNTFGCYVDDQLWLPYAEHTLDRSIEPEYDSGWFSVRVEREVGNIPLMNLQLSDTLGFQMKTYTQDNGFSAGVYRTDDGVYNYYSSAPGDEASITLTKVEAPAHDGSRQVIISGRFSFVVTCTANGKKIRVSDGRFDIKAR